MRRVVVGGGEIKSSILALESKKRFGEKGEEMRREK